MTRSIDTRDIQRTYSERFAGRVEYRAKIWKILVSYFKSWVPANGAVLDLGAGYCEFINNINAEVKYAMDLNPEIHRRAGPGVTILHQDCSDSWPLNDSELDVIFTSNFLEHLPDKEAVRRTLLNAYRCLKPGGRFIAMGPNIKYTHGSYWDFFDHYVALTELSLCEVLSNCGFEAEKQVGRFLPYTMSSGRQYSAWLLRLYLMMPAVWPLFGKQFLVIGQKHRRSLPSKLAVDRPLEAG